MKRLKWKNISFMLSIILILVILTAPIIPNTIRWIIISVIVLLDVLSYLYSRRSKKERISIVKVILKVLLIILVMIPNSLFSNFIRGISSKTETYEINFVGLEEIRHDNIKDFEDKKIGILNDENSKIGYIYPKSIFDEAGVDVKYIEFSSYIDSIQALMNKKIDVIILPGGYEITFTEIENLEIDTSILYTQYKVTKTEKVNLLGEHQDILNLVLIGGDSPIEGDSTSGLNYDVIIVISYNFKTQESAMISIPRDSYITNSCTNKKDKITHTGWYGADCLTETLSDFLDINLDKYMLIDFEGLIDVVDSLGGVKIDVEQTMTEQNETGSEVIEIEAGKQVLNGQKALVYLRHRKSLADGVFGRSNHHEQFILAMVEQLASPSSWFKINGFLNTVQQSVLTNLSGNSLVTYYNDASIILSRYGVEALFPERLELKATDAMIYTPSVGRELYYSILNTESVNAVKEKFKSINTVEEKE